MLHYVQQLLTNFVCLLYSAEQVVYSTSLEIIHWKQATTLAEWWEGKEKVTLQAVQLNNEKFSESGDNSL